MLNMFAYRLLPSLCLYRYLFVALSYLKGLEAATYEEIQGHLEMGKQFLARGQYGDALSHYHAAVEGDPNNYLNYFKRATVFLALGKSKSATEDLNAVLELKPDFLAARIQRGNVLLKQGLLDEAHIEFERVLRIDPLNEEAQRHYTIIEPLKRDITLAQVMVEDRNYLEAIELLTKLIHELPWDVELREMRANSYEAIGNIMNAIGDLRPTTKLRPDNTRGYLRLSFLYYEVAETEESLNMIRECLKLDPDHKECFAHYKKVKKLAAQLRSIQEFISQGQYVECAEKANAAFKTESSKRTLVHLIKSKLCHCLNKAGQPSEAIEACTEAMEAENQDVNTICERAEAYIANEQYEEAIQDYQRAMQIDENSNRAREGESRAKKLLKQLKKRDYYKILGVKRTAGKREILKAYRKLAQKWHPDNYQGDEKKKAENKFIDIAAAKEVLTDPEKRQKFDNGEDPLDPESQAGQGFNPFAQGFHPFGHGGGPFTFKFHFS